MTDLMPPIAGIWTRTKCAQSFPRSFHSWFIRKLVVEDVTSSSNTHFIFIVP
jgi:hypothetical protein